MEASNETAGTKRKVKEEDDIMPRPKEAKLRKRPVEDAKGHVIWRTGAEDADSARWYKIPVDWFGTVLPPRDVFLDAIHDFPYLSTRESSSWLANAIRFVMILRAKGCQQFHWDSTGVPIFTNADMTIDTTLFE